MSFPNCLSRQISYSIRYKIYLSRQWKKEDRILAIRAHCAGPPFVFAVSKRNSWLEEPAPKRRRGPAVKPPNPQGASGEKVDPLLEWVDDEGFQMKMAEWHFEWNVQPDAVCMYWGCRRLYRKTYQAMKQSPGSSRYTYALNGLVLMTRAVYTDALIVTTPLATQYVAEAIPMVASGLDRAENIHKGLTDMMAENKALKAELKAIKQRISPLGQM